MGAATFVRDREAVGKLLTVAATIVVPYALWPLVMVWAVLYFSASGVWRLATRDEIICRAVPMAMAARPGGVSSSQLTAPNLGIGRVVARRYDLAPGRRVLTGWSW